VYQVFYVVSLFFFVHTKYSMHICTRGRRASDDKIDRLTRSWTSRYGYVPNQTMLDMGSDRIMVRFGFCCNCNHVGSCYTNQFCFEILRKSPFGKRCTCIHDPRIGGPQASWLPHTETQGNTIATDINVESLHQKRLNTIHYDNPFGVEALTPIPKGTTLPYNNEDLHLKQWNALYSLVTGSGVEGWVLDNKQHRRSAKQIHPIVKVQIAIAMRQETTHDWQYKYRPQHFVHGEFCMILSTRAFRVDNVESTSTKPIRKNRQKSSSNKKNVEMNVVEIPLSTYKSDSNRHIMAREIAFGPDCDPSVRGVAIWFHIEDEDVSICTPQQAKRFRWKKGIKNNKVAENPDCQNEQKNSKAGNKSPSIFDSQSILESYPMVRPQDPVAYALVTDTLKHHLSVLRTERISNMKERFEALKTDQSNEKELSNRFQKLRQDWIRWTWPVNAGRDCTDATTPVPPVDAKYEIKQISSLNPGNESNALGESTKGPGTQVHRVWDSFVDTLCEHGNVYLSSEMEPFNGSAEITRHRLPIFELLGSGKGIQETDRSLPHIHGSYKITETKKASSDSNDDKERCWKSLLLEPTPETGILVSYTNETLGILRTEWDIVLDHFVNSRSQKVLSIIQQ
jgi:hypothetical protein